MTIQETVWHVEVTLDAMPPDEAIKDVQNYMEYVGPRPTDEYARFGTYVCALGLRQAANLGLDRAFIVLREACLQESFRGLQVVSEALRLELAAQRPRLPDIVGVAEIQEVLAVNSRQRVGQLAARPDFPDPIARLKAGNIWLRSEIVDFGRLWQPTRRRKSAK
jgi:hypothetical protein